MFLYRIFKLCVVCLLLFARGHLHAEETQPRPRLYLMSYSHLDTQWLWPYEDSIEKHLKSTLDDNFRLFEKYPEHQFNFTGAYRYKLMKAYWPARYETLKRYVAGGRWHPVGSSWEENDVILPDPESIQRQILYGNKFFHEEFGKPSSDYLLPDSFGFPSSLPTVIHHAGLLGFSSQKLHWGGAREVPFNLGLWEGADGSKIMAIFNPGPYESSVPKDFDQGQWFARLMAQPKLGVAPVDYRYFGIGDIGGSPREDDVRNLAEVLGKPDRNFDIISGRSDQFFRDYENAPKDQWPEVKGELLLTEHSAGILSSNSQLKGEHRRAEHMARQAEYLATVAAFVDGTIYPKAKIRKAWETLLPVQMHDIITGTSIPKAVSHSMNDLAIAQNLFRGVIDHAAGLIAQKLDKSEKGYAVALFNSLSQSRSEIARITLPKHQGTFTHVITPEGETLPLQTVPNKFKPEAQATTYLFPVQMGPMESSLFTLIKLEGASVPNTDLKNLPASAEGLESDLYSLRIGKSGDIVSLITRASGREELASPVRYHFTGEFPQKYPAWNMTWKDRKRPPRAYLESKPKISVLYEGLWQSAVRVERRALGSTFVQTIRLSRGQPVIQIEENINWRTRNAALKVALHPRIQAQTASYDMGLAVEERPGNHPKLFEMPQHSFASMTDGRHGLSLVNACCYGADKPSDDILRLTLLYTPHSSTQEFRYNETQDFGRHLLNWGFMPHSGDWRAANTRSWAEALNEPLLAYHPDIEPEVLRPGPLGKRYSFLKTEGAVIKLVKQEENLGDNSRVLIRLYEREGQGKKAFKIQFPSALTEVTEVNGQEQAIGEPKAISGTSFTGEIANFGIKSYIFKLNPMAANRNPISTIIPLPFNVKAFSDQSRSLQSTLANGSLSFPIEEYPSYLRNSGVEFDLKATRSQGPDTLSAAGQRLTLPKEAKGELHILAFSTRDHLAKVVVDGKTLRLAIPKFHGRIADGDRRKLDAKGELQSIRPAFLRRTPIAAYANLTHGKVGRLTYYPSYLFHCVLPPGKVLEIPPDPDFFIVALTASAALPTLTALDETESNCEASL